MSITKKLGNMLRDRLGIEDKPRETIDAEVHSRRRTIVSFDKDDDGNQIEVVEVVKWEALEFPDDEIIDAITASNIKSIAGSAGMLANAMQQNMTAHSNRMDILQQTIAAEALTQRAGVDVTESKLNPGVKK